MHAIDLDLTLTVYVHVSPLCVTITSQVRPDELQRALGRLAARGGRGRRARCVRRVVGVRLHVDDARRVPVRERGVRATAADPQQGATGCHDPLGRQVRVCVIFSVAKYSHTETWDLGSGI